MKIALHRLVRAHRKKSFVLQRAQQHRLLVQAEFADFIEKQQPFVRFPQKPGAIRLGPGERAAPVAKQGRGRRVPAESGAVDLHYLAIQSATLVPQLVNAPCELAFSRTGRPH